MSRSDHADEIARAFHATYEHLAPAYGYVTRPESAVDWEDVPAANRELMTHVVGNLVAEGVIAPGSRFGGDEVDDGDSGPICGLCGMRRPRPGFTACDVCA